MQIAVTAVCAVIALFSGGVTVGLLLLGVVDVEAVGVAVYRHRSQRE
jgi:hypothetical protein